MPTDAEIATHLSLSSRMVRDLRAMGRLPAPGAHLKACRASYFAYLRTAAANAVPPEPSELDRQRARLADEQANALERRNAEARRLLMPTAQTLAAVLAMVDISRARLHRVAAEVGRDDADLRRRIGDAIGDALQDFTPEAATAAVARVNG